MRILENRGNWYKGNMHMHTTESDGVLDPVEAIGVYREAGYDFIAITDHAAGSLRADRADRWRRPESLVLTFCGGKKTVKNRYGKY